MRLLHAVGIGRTKALGKHLVGDEVRHLWSRLRVSLNGRTESARSVALCATFPGEGTSTAAANLAMFLAEQGRSVCLVEANLRTPCLARRFQVPPSPGLADYIAGDAGVDDVMRNGVAPGVALVPAGRAPADLYVGFSGGGLERFLAEPKLVASAIVIDAPPLSQAPESVLVVKPADLVVLVVEAHRTHREAVERSVATLRELRVQLGGTILNRLRHDLPVFLDRLL
jgi:Mrp family chromosome partitioning ATPase